MKILITSPSLNPLKNVSGISSVVRNIIKLDGFDFVHFKIARTDQTKRDFHWILSQFKVLRNLFVVIIKNKIDLIHFNTDLTTVSIVRDFVFIQIAAFLGIKRILHIHGGKYLIQDCKYKVVNFMIWANIKNSLFVIVLSEYEKSIISKKYKCSKIVTIPNSIDFHEIKYVDQLNYVELRLIFFGRIHESKGIEEIILVLDRLNKRNVDFTFYVYGDGPQKDYFLAELYNKIGNKCVYQGIADNQNKWNALINSDVFLLPSHGEGLPMAMLEAMAVGKIVIVSDDASMKTVITDKYNGIIVNKYDHENIFERLNEIINNKSLFQKISENAKKTIEQDFNWKINKEKLRKIYLQCQK